MSIDSFEHDLLEDILQIDLKSNQIFKKNDHFRNILQDNGELLTINYSPNSRTCSYIFHMPSGKIKYKILRVECIDRKTQSIKQYFKVAEIFEYELRIQHGFLIETKILEEGFNFVTPSNPLDLHIHQQSSQIKFVEVGLGFHYRTLENNLIILTPDKILADIFKLFNTCTSAHQIAFATAIEQLSNSRVNVETKFSRMLLAELERVNNHLLWLGLLFMGMGRNELTNELMHLRRNAVEIQNDIIGTKQSVILNNPAYTLSQEQIDHTKVKIIALISKIVNLTDNQDYGECLELLSNIGSFKYEESVKSGVVGPIARAAGIEKDTRKQQPYLLYEEMRLPDILGEDGTLREIVKVRLKEVGGSFSIINQILHQCVPWYGVQPNFFPVLNSDATVIVNVEAPNGRLTYYMQTDKLGKISQLRITIPSITNFIPTIKRMLGEDMKWLPTISRLIDMGIDPLENLVVFDIETGENRFVTAHEIRQSSVNSILSKNE